MKTLILIIVSNHKNIETIRLVIQLFKQLGIQLKSYAQYWMGVHSNGLSYVKDNKDLKEYLKINKQPELGLLFKVLSIGSCLSIQVHPSRSQAQILHKSRPDLYLDENDKPEMTLTLSEHFELLHGYIDRKQLNQLVSVEPFKGF